MGQGIVTSDLHLFTKRSQPQLLLDKLYAQLPDCDILVLNGDIFDFRWTILPTIEHTIDEAERWLVSVMRDFPALELHYVLGNHDCYTEFVECLQGLEIHYPSFKTYEYYAQLGTILFLHGDCANYAMTFKHHAAARDSWRRCGKLPSICVGPYEMCDRLKITKLCHQICFPKSAVARRITHYLNTLPTGMPPDICDIYLGHTHLPFQDFQWQDYRFHTTGSAIQGLDASLLRFEVAENTSIRRRAYEYTS